MKALARVKATRRWRGQLPPQRFASKIKPLPNGCWLYTGAKEKSGYGKFSIGRVTVLAHCYAFECVRGVIPKGLTLDHKCRLEGCVRPSHLEPVTIRINLLRGNTLQAANVAKTHCPKGHPYDEQNTYRVKDGSRMCRECGRQRVRARRARDRL